MNALAYVASNSVPGSPKEGYLEMIIAAAEKNGFPAEYNKHLKKFKE